MPVIAKLVCSCIFEHCVLLYDVCAKYRSYKKCRKFRRNFLIFQDENKFKTHEMVSSNRFQSRQKEDTQKKRAEQKGDKSMPKEKFMRL
jgi:hypothetical protein